MSNDRQADLVTMKLRRDNARLIDAIDNILTAYYKRPYSNYLNGLDMATQAARELIEDMGPEAPRE